MKRSNLRNIIVREVGKLEMEEDELVGVVCVQNGCCPGRAVLIARVRWDEGGEEHAQFYARCACGEMRCRRTGFHESIKAAIRAYEEMPYVRDREFLKTLALRYNRLAMVPLRKEGE